MHALCLLLTLLSFSKRPVSIVHNPTSIALQPLSPSRQAELADCIKIHNIPIEKSAWLLSLVAGGTGLEHDVAPEFIRPTPHTPPQAHTLIPPPLLPATAPPPTLPKQCRHATKKPKCEEGEVKTVLGHSFDEHNKIFYTVEWITGGQATLPRENLMWVENGVEHINSVLRSYELSHFGFSKHLRASNKSPSTSHEHPQQKPAAKSKKKK
jgi:hypothetical protein